MATDSQWALQQAVYTALTGDATLQGFIGTRVYDHVPQGDATLPYVVIGEATAVPADTKTTDGMEHTLTVHTWDDAHRGHKTIKQVMDAILDVLDHASFSVSGFNLVQTNFEFSDTFADPDGLTRQGVQRFRVLISQ